MDSRGVSGAHTLSQFPEGAGNLLGTATGPADLFGHGNLLQMQLLYVESLVNLLAWMGPCVGGRRRSVSPRSHCGERPLQLPVLAWLCVQRRAQM